MGVVRNITDGIANVVANLGTGRDKMSHSRYVDNAQDPGELLTAYRNSWLARAIVDYPAEDATRNWRQWRAESEQITKIEKLSNRLGVQRRVQDALVAARLYGGAAIYINTSDEQKDQQLVPGPGVEIKSLVVLTCNSLKTGPIEYDIDSPYYGRPQYYMLLNRDNQSQVRIHPSRLVVFRGSSVPLDSFGITSCTNNGWGDSVLKSAHDAMLQADSTMANIASLVFEAKVDIFKFEGFAKLLAEGQDKLVINRMHHMAAMKGINGAVVTDLADEYDQKSATFTGLPEVANAFRENVSGAARIPITRLFGRSSAGLSGQGDGDERVYYDRVSHVQSTEVSPAMELLDECLIWQALGSRPEEIYYEWSPLRQMTESERAKIFLDTANAARALAGSNAGEMVPIDALSDALVNELTEQGALPGLDQAIEKYGSLAEQNEFIGGG